MDNDTIIVVWYDSNVPGKGEFWRGPSTEVAQIRNVIARRLAHQTVQDNCPHHWGMWHTAIDTS